MDSTLNQAQSPKEYKEIKEPTLLEQLEFERRNQIQRLGELTLKIEMLKEDPSLDEKIRLFNRY